MHSLLNSWNLLIVLLLFYASQCTILKVFARNKLSTANSVHCNITIIIGKTLKLIPVISGLIIRFKTDEEFHLLP